MSAVETYINMFLQTELTAISRLLGKYIGNYYNNMLCNGATWMFFAWFILHAIFDDILNGLLRRMKFKEYIRTRLQKSLWYLGFYMTALLYSSATLLRNDIKLVTANEPFDGMNSPCGHLILGFIVMLTFYLHSTFWAKTKHRDIMLALICFSLSLLMFASYFLKFVEGIFRLTVLVCLTQVTVELARCTALMKRDVITRAVFTASLVAFIVNYLMLIPLLLGYPLMKRFSTSGVFLWVCLVIWLILEIYTSVLFKAISHWLNHTKDDKMSCNKDIFECSLFPPRSDATYNYCILRKEMAEREAQSLLLRKPKARNMVFQTLKCMVAIKRKLNEKRPGENNIHDNPIDDNESVGEELGTNSSVVDDAEEVEEIVGGRLEFNINSKNGEEEKLKEE